MKTQPIGGLFRRPSRASAVWSFVERVSGRRCRQPLSAINQVGSRLLIRSRLGAQPIRRGAWGEGRTTRCSLRVNPRRVVGKGCDALAPHPLVNLLAMLVAVLHPAMLMMVLVVDDRRHLRSVRMMDSRCFMANFCACKTGSKHHRDCGDGDSQSSLHACSPSFSRRPLRSAALPKQLY